jgi:hypothetical protein
MIANNIGTGAVDTAPTSYRLFDVPPEVFRKFQTGRNKFERWSKYLDLQNEEQKAIYDYARKKPRNTIVLRDSSTGALRSIRRKASNQL